MRFIAGVLALSLAACADREPEEQAQVPAAAAAAEVPAAASANPAQSAPLMAIPDDPTALKRLQDMGYTIHEDHLHAPGVTACPKMAENPVM